jgi:hypothetical protein
MIKTPSSEGYTKRLVLLARGGKHCTRLLIMEALMVYQQYPEGYSSHNRELSAQTIGNAAPSTKTVEILKLSAV